MHRGALKDLFLVGALFIAALAMAQPRGGFPLNDDWSYTRILKQWIDGGPLQISGWAAVTLIAQIWWGRLACGLFGFSFDVLRLSTIGLALVALTSLYGIFRQLNMNRRLLLAGLLTLAFNPFFFSLSVSYMTEVPFLAGLLTSFYFGARYFNRQRWIDLFLLSFFSAGTVLIRQTGLVLPVGFALVAIMKRRSPGMTVGPLLIPPIVSLTALACFMVWTNSQNDHPHGFYFLLQNVLKLWTGPKQILLSVISHQIIALAMYAALAALPWVVFTHRPLRQPVHRYIAIGVMLLMAALLWWQGALMPMKGNLLYDLGLGPILLRDVAILHAPHHPSAGLFFRLPLTLISAMGLILGARSLWQQKTAVMSHPLRLWALVTGGLYALPFIASTYFFDRQIIFFLPLLMIILSDAASSRTNRIGGAALWAVLAVFSIAGTHDYFSWNRTRWQALHQLMQEDGIPSSKIDGGFEFNGWLHYVTPYKKQAHKSWWWVQEDQFVVTMGALSTHTIYRTHPYRRWLPPGTGLLYVMERTPAVEAGKENPGKERLDH